MPRNSFDRKRNRYYVLLCHARYPRTAERTTNANVEYAVDRLRMPIIQPIVCSFVQSLIIIVIVNMIIINNLRRPHLSHHSNC